MLFKLGADISDISILAFNNLSTVFINEHYADGCISLLCFPSITLVVEGMEICLLLFTYFDTLWVQRTGENCVMKSFSVE